MNQRTTAHFQTLASLTWPWFLLWTGLAMVLMPLHIGDHHFDTWIGNAGLAGACKRLLAMFDAIWIVLAAANVYLHAASVEGLKTARAWALRVLLAAAVIGTVGALTGFPLGRFVYTDRLGVCIGNVLPFGMPLLWMVVIITNRYFVLAFRPGWGGWRLALAAAGLVLLTDLNLERIAWQVRFWWIWFPHQYTTPHWPPVQNFATWFVVAFLLVLGMRSRFPGNDPLAAARARLAPGPRIRHLRPALVLVLMNTVFLAIHALG